MRVRHDGVVLAHDYLTQRGGAERVVLTLSRAFPGAPIVTSLYDPSLSFPELRDCPIRTGALQHIPGLQQHHRLGLPLYAAAFSACHIEAPLTLCSTSGWSHGVRTLGKKLLYVYTPARWLYDVPSYLGSDARAIAKAVNLVAPPLRAWDRRAAASATRILTISHRSKRRIENTWGLDAEVLHPPLTVRVEGPSASPRGHGLEPGFLLLVARLLPYKGIHAVLGAMERLPDYRLVVVGDGPERARLARACPTNALLLGRVEDHELRWLYGNCQAFISAAVEDFGLSALEAMAHGKPAVVVRAGGFEETVIEGTTGVFFDTATPAGIARAVRQLPQGNWRPGDLKSYASRYSEAAFISSIRQVVGEMI